MFQPTLRFSHYRILRREDGSPWRLGVGAMGVTYKAVDERLRVEVALKVIAPHRLHEPQVQALFLREARAAARVRHTNVASVLALDDTPGNSYYAMEFVPGQTLEEQLRTDRRFVPAVAFAVAAQIARGLEAIHAQGIVHRDLKPANVMLHRPRAATTVSGESGGWEVKIIDFGLARIFEGETVGESNLGSSVGFRGTVLYASPEQCQERADLDGRADLYALGCILWEMLTGDLPFRAKSQVGLMNAHLSTPPPLERLAGLDTAAQEAVLRLLAKAREDRPPNAGRAAQELEQCAAAARATGADPLPPPAEPPAPRAVSSSMATVAAIPAWEATIFQPARGRWLERALLGLVLCAVGTAFWLHYARSPSSAPAGPPPATASESPAAPIAELIQAIEAPDCLPEDFAQAEDLAKAALARDPAGAAGIIAMARVQVGLLVRGFDRREERFDEARRWVERAGQASPSDPEAQAARGVYLTERRIELDWALQLLRSAVATAPSEPRHAIALNNLLAIHPGTPPGAALADAERDAQRFPTNALVLYNLARRHREANQLAGVQAALDRAIALTPLTNAVTWRARLLLLVEGDWRGARALLDRIPPRYRALDRVVIVRVFCALFGQEPQDGLQALTAVTGSWLQDFAFTGPKALLTAALLEVEGKRELARLQYEAALTELRTHLARTPGDAGLRLHEIWALRGLGREEEARGLLRAQLESVPRPFRMGYAGSTANSWFGLLPCALLLGERETSLTLIREAAPVPEERLVLRGILQVDPRLAQWREDPEFVALLAGPR